MRGSRPRFQVLTTVRRGLALGLSALLPIASSAAWATPWVAIDLANELGATERHALSLGLAGLTLHTESAAVQAVERAEMAFLEMNLSAAEEDLTSAVATFLGQPVTVKPSVAYKSVILLAQVLSSSRRAEAASRLLEQALDHWSDFPGEVAVPPALHRPLNLARERLNRAQPGKLHLESEPSQLTVYLGNRILGQTPLLAERLPLGPERACVEGPLGRLCRDVHVEKDPLNVHWVADAPQARRALGQSLRDQDQVRGLEAVAQIGQVFGGQSWCLIVLDRDQAIIAQVTGPKIQAGLSLGIQQARRDWAAVGGRCLSPELMNIDAQATQKLLWPEPTPVWAQSEGVAPASEHSQVGWWLGWSSIGGAAALTGLGISLGLSAKDSAQLYKAQKRTSDLDRAKSHALGADIAYISGAVLAGLGLYLVLSSD